MSDEILKIAPNGQWSLEKSKVIRPKGFGLPKRPNTNYATKPIDNDPNIAGQYNQYQDSESIYPPRKEEIPYFDPNNDVVHHEHQHRLNSLIGKQLKFQPEDPHLENRGSAVAHHIWHSANLSPFEKEAVRLVNRHVNGYSDVDPDENLACLVGWLNAGNASRQYALGHIHADENRNIAAHEVDPYMRSAFKKIQRAANNIKPGQVIHNPFGTGPDEPADLRLK